MNLRAYQIEISHQACDILHKYGMVYLAMQTRTGKSITAFEIAKLYGAKCVLFATKKKAITSISNDYLNFQYNRFYKIVVTNYEALHNVENIKDFDLFVLDECHNLSQYPKMALRTKRLKAIIGYKPVIYLSATPVAEGYSKIFHQLHVSSNSPYKNYKNFYQWAHDYVNIKKVRRGIYEVNDYSEANEERIKKDIARITISLSQEEAGFVSPVQEHFVEVEDDIIHDMLKRMNKNKIITLETGSIVGDTPGTFLQKMHQLSGGTCKLDNDTSVIISRKKIEKIKEMFSEMKIAIFYQFVKELEIIKECFGDLITDNPEEFQTKKELIFVSQFISAKEGIALHCADAIIFYNISYSATTYFQSRARLQSLERKTPANIYWIFTKGGIERKVYGAISKKKNFTYGFYMRNVAHELY